jgi:site-specific DNA-methyltransferase (adenine-specific)
MPPIRPRLPLNQIVCGDNVTVMKTFPDACIDLVVTSPPYDNLRTYGGHTWDFEGVAEQLTRVLKPGGVIVWVVADATIDGSETGTSFRQALHFKDVCGLRLHDTMIWQKDQVAFPDSARYYQKFEFMYVLSRGSPKTFNPIADHPNVSAGRKVTGKDRSSDGGFRDRSGLGRQYPDFSVRGNVWLVPNQSRGIHTENHPASFPEALARDQCPIVVQRGGLGARPVCWIGDHHENGKGYGQAVHRH